MRWDYAGMASYRVNGKIQREENVMNVKKICRSGKKECFMVLEQ